MCVDEAVCFIAGKANFEEESVSIRIRFFFFCIPFDWRSFSVFNCLTSLPLGNIFRYLIRFTSIAKINYSFRKQIYKSADRCDIMILLLNEEWVKSKETFSEFCMLHSYVSLFNSIAVIAEDRSNHDEVPPTIIPVIIKSGM